MRENVSRHFKPFLAGFALLAATSFSYATDGKSDSDWSGKFTIGVQAFTGNAVMNFLNLSADVKYNEDFNAGDPIRHRLKGSYAFADYELPESFGSDVLDMIDNHSISYEMDYFLDNRSYASLMAMHYHDNPAGIDSFHALGLEYTRILSASDSYSFSGTLGVAPITETEYNDGQTFDGVGGKAALNFSGKISDTISLQQSFEVLTTENLTFTSANTAAEMQLTESISLQLSYSYKHFSEVPADSKKTDTITGLNIVLGF